MQNYFFSMDIAKKRLSKKQVIMGIYFTLALIASIQSLLNGPTKFLPSIAYEYTHYNNYVIFKNSFFHLLKGEDLYVLYPSEQWDLYKYTPTFAVFFGFFAILPDWLGLNLWNVLNALLLALAIFRLPNLQSHGKGIVLLIICVEMVTSLRNEQSNALIAGLIVFSFSFLEKRNYLAATLLIALSAFIKLFGVVAFFLLLLYPHKLKSISYALLWLIVLFLIPLVLIDVSQYHNQISSFVKMLMNDHESSYGYSVMGILYSFTGYEWNKIYVLATGVGLFLVPYLQWYARP